MIKTIFFDYAGVLTATRDKTQFAKENHARFGITTHALLDILYKNWDKAAINEISETEYWEWIGGELKTNPKEIRELVYAAFPIDVRMLEIIDQIKDRYTLVMVSNQLEDWLEKVIDDNNLRKRFDHFVNSYQVGISKPDKRIYLAALEKSNSKPEETLYIDDLPANISSAKELGIKTIEFKSFEQFIEEFNAYSGNI